MRIFSVLAPPLCAACRRPCRESLVLCPACGHALDFLERTPVTVRDVSVWAPVAYEGPARTLVRRLKFHGAQALASHMAATIAAGAPAGMLDGPLVPVPSPPGRRRRRGFCHAELLARELGARAGLEVRPLLERIGDSRRQVGRARSERVRRPPRFAALQTGIENVVLVDDVVTTGATLGACARALRQAGCSCDSALAYARTPVR